MLEQQVSCPLCRVPPDASGVCPDCGQDLSPLTYLEARPALHYNRSLELARSGDDEGAVRSLALALAEDENFVDAWVVLGKLYIRMGRDADARRAWTAAVAIEPGQEGAVAALAGLDAASASAGLVERRERRRRLLLVAAMALVTLLAGLAVLRLWAYDGEAGFLAVALRGDDVVLAGPVADERIRREFVEAGGVAADSRALIDALVVEAGSAPVSGLDAGAVSALVSALVDGPRGDRSVVLSGSRVVLTGAVPDEAARALLVDAIRGALPDASVDDRIVVGTPPDPGGGGQSDKAARLDNAIEAVQAAGPITFVPDTATLTPQGSATVMVIAELLRDEERISIQIDGHAARTRGTSERALEVSEQRAVVVRDALVAAGVDPARMSPRGLADAQPLATLGASRRVEVSVR